MRLGKISFLVFILVFFTLFSSAFSSISMLPGYINVEETQGAFEPGEEFELSFYVDIDNEEPVILEPRYQPPSSSKIWGGDFNIEESQYSEQDISSWIDMGDSFVIRPDDEVDEDFLSADRELTVTIQIPEDAEPGYHGGQISMRPQQQEGEGGYGFGAITTSISDFIFKVEGEAEREIEFSDIQSVRTGEDSIQLIQQFENTGTVTTTVDPGEITIVNGEGREVGSVDMPQTKIAPGEFEEVEGTWFGGQEGGEYQLEGTADYMTGQAYVGGEESQFVIQGAIRDAINVENVNDDLEEDSSSGSAPLWLVVMVLVLLGVLMYSMDIDPFWIVLLLGLTGVSSIILLTGLPNWTLPVLLLMSGAVIYYS